MATIIRVGLIVGGIAFVLLYALQSHMGLGVVPGITLAGVLAGLGMAKWLDRAWYGRQLEAGARAGLIASSIAAVGVLVSLITLGPHTVAGLARLSRGPAYDFGPFIRTLGFAGWAGAGIVFILAALAAGVLASAGMAQVFGWSKSARVTRVITQARLAAQAINRDEGWRGSTPGSVMGQQAHTSALLAQLQGTPHSGSPITSNAPAVGLATPPGYGAAAAPSAGGGMPPADTAAPLWPPAPGGPSAGRAKKKAQPQEPAASAARQAPQPKSPAEAPRKGPARDIDRASTEDLKAAFEAWDRSQRADEPSRQADDAAGANTTDGRIPTDSGYLNSVRPVPPKRNRKKQATRDWLC